MFTLLNKKSLMLQSAVLIGLMSSASQAQAGNNFGDIARNINDSIAELPGLLTGICYLFGMLIGTLGILKIKDHVENPSQTPMKDGAIRLAAGGALFALPIVFEAMTNTIGTTTTQTTAAKLNKVTFNVF
ncbi:MAG: hypothetical protein ACK4VI_08080 [Alphaproteobacteria bacterium]